MPRCPLAISVAQIPLKHHRETKTRGENACQTDHILDRSGFNRRGFYLFRAKRDCGIRGWHTSRVDHRGHLHGDPGPAPTLFSKATTALNVYFSLSATLGSSNQEYENIESFSAKVGRIFRISRSMLLWEVRAMTCCTSGRCCWHQAIR